MSEHNDDYIAETCPACGQPADYCKGHGMMGDPKGYRILSQHDADNHSECHRDALCTQLRIAHGVATFLITALLVVCSVILAPSAHATADPDTHVGDHTGWRSSVFMVGDSITYMGRDDLRAVGRNWEVSAKPGRTVMTLGGLIKDRLANPHPLRVLIIALGTNGDPKWTKANYVHVTQWVPKSTRVIFVSTWRDPHVWGDAKFKSNSRVQDRYSQWMRQIAKERPHTHVAEWRTFIANHRSLLVDGVHPNEEGQRWWAQIISRTASLR